MSKLAPTIRLVKVGAFFSETSCGLLHFPIDASRSLRNEFRKRCQFVCQQLCTLNRLLTTCCVLQQSIFAHFAQSLKFFIRNNTDSLWYYCTLQTHRQILNFNGAPYGLDGSRWVTRLVSLPSVVRGDSFSCLGLLRCIEFCSFPLFSSQTIDFLIVAIPKA